MFPGGLEALPLDSPKRGQRKQEVSCPDHSAGLEPLPPRRGSARSSAEHLNQPALASASLLAAGPPSPGRGRASPRCSGSAAPGALTGFVGPLPFLLALRLGNESAASRCSRQRLRVDGARAATRQSGTQRTSRSRWSTLVHRALRWAAPAGMCVSAHTCVCTYMCLHTRVLLCALTFALVGVFGVCPEHGGSE